MAILNYLLRRALRHWQLFLTLSLGVILATALLASGPLLVDTVAQFGLRHKIKAAEPLDSNLRLRTHELTEEPLIRDLDTQVRAMLGNYLGDYESRTILSVRSYWLIPWVGGEQIQDQRVCLRFYEGFEDHVDFVAGAWPMGGVVLTDTVSVVIGEGMAQAYGLSVGDRLPLSYQPSEVEPSRWLQIAGIARSRDPSDPYWFGEYSPLRVQGDKRWSAQYSTVPPADSFYQGVAALLPGTESELSWHVLLAPEEITVAGIPELRGGIAALQQELYHSEERVLIDSGLDELLVNFATQAEAVRGPLYILTAEIVLLALYYVIMVAALSVQQAEREFAILRSRGASGWHIFRIQAMEAALVSVVALLSGPGLAVVMLRGISRFGPLSDVRVSDWALNLTGASWLAAGVAAVACVVGLLLPLGPTLRRSIVTHQQALVRPPRAPWWQRIYLDVILLLVGLVLLWRLHLYGGVVAGGAARPKVDWLLLLSPLILLVGSATILLRIFPLILRLFARLTGRGRGLPGALAMWQVSRNPTRVVLLVLLLTLAMSLGILSSGLNATLDVNEWERAQYAVGGDMRFVSGQSLGLSGMSVEPGIRAVTSVARGRGTVDLKTYRSLPRFEILAVDPRSIAGVSAFRDDFAERPMAEMLAQIVVEGNQASRVLPLPGRPISLGLWMWGYDDDENYMSSFRPQMRGNNDLDRIALVAKLRTAQGEMVSLPLQPPADLCSHPCCAGGCRNGPRTALWPHQVGEWRYFSAVLPELPPASYPLAFHSLWLQNRARYPSGQAAAVPMELAIDDITVIDGQTGRMQVAEGFEDPLSLWSMADYASGAHREKDHGLAHSGEARQVVFIGFARQSQWVSFNISRPYGRETLPALASPAFLQATEIHVGDSVSAWISSLPAVTLHIVGTVQYFPTLYENQPAPSEHLEAGFLVVSRDALLACLNDRGPTSVNAGELWLATDGQIPNEQLKMVVPAMDRVWDAEAVRGTIKADPMALGLRSVTFFGYLLTSILSIVGFATHFYMSARQREAVYGILRTMGLSPRQLYGSLVLEQVILILSGLVLGTFLGVVLNRLVLPGLPITMGDRPPIPPFRPFDDWAAVGNIYLILGTAFLLSLGVATLLLWRARIHRVLRIGEE